MAPEIFQGRRLLAVLAGGFFGTITRYLLSLGIQQFVGKSWPYDILLINITGAFLLAFLTTLADAAVLIGPQRRLFFNVGFIGAYTTFSTLALGTVNLALSNQSLAALLYIFCSLLGGILSVLLGQFCGVASIAGIQQRQQRIASARVNKAEEEALYLSSDASLYALEEEEKTF